MVKKEIELIATKIVDSAFRVHRELGPGLLESVYQHCLTEELRIRHLVVRQELFLPIFYKGKKLDKDFRIDILVEEEVILEIKSVDILAPIHEAQLLTYLRLSNKWLGFLLNFNVPVMKQGIRRFVNGYR